MSLLNGLRQSADGTHEFAPLLELVHVSGEYHINRMIVLTVAEHFFEILPLPLVEEVIEAEQVLGVALTHHTRLDRVILIVTRLQSRRRVRVH